jgi:hypothetical protein
MKFLKGLIVGPIKTPLGNCWTNANNISISTDGLNANNNATGWRSVSARKGFAADGTPPAVFYFEITIVPPYKGSV